MNLKIKNTPPEWFSVAVDVALSVYEHDTTCVNGLQYIRGFGVHKGTGVYNYMGYWWVYQTKTSYIIQLLEKN